VDGHGGPSDEFLGSLIEQAVTAAQRQVPAVGQDVGIGEGEPGWKGLFHQAYNDLMSQRQRLWIGDPASVVYWDGPGVVQHFEAAHLLFGWVLCALPHHRPVAVAGEIWQVLRAAGAGAPGGDALRAVGFPVPDPHSTRVVDAAATSVDLTGGQWGDGRLARSPGEPEWHWEPAVRLDKRMTRAAGYWTAPPAPRQLRLRAVATLPWADADALAITPQRRRALEQHLPASKLAELVTTMCRRRSADLTMTGWSRGPGRNALDALSYSGLITAPGGRTVLSVQVMAALPGAVDSSVVTCAELCIQDPSARRPGPSRDGGADPVGRGLRCDWHDARRVAVRGARTRPGPHGTRAARRRGRYRRLAVRHCRRQAPVREARLQAGPPERRVPWTVPRRPAA
jgi:hypothetical protein